MYSNTACLITEENRRQLEKDVTSMLHSIGIKGSFHYALTQFDKPMHPMVTCLPKDYDSKAVVHIENANGAVKFYVAEYPNIINALCYDDYEHNKQIVNKTDLIIKNLNDMNLPYSITNEESLC